MNLRERSTSVAVAAWLPLLGLFAWWWLTRDDSSFYFPSLATIWAAFKEEWLFERFVTDLLPSLFLFAGGYLIAAAVGIGFGVLLGMWPLGRRAILPTLDFLRAVPAPAFISVLVLLLGFEQSMKLAVIAFTALFPILLNTIDGVRGISGEQLDLAKVYRLSRADRIMRVVIPAASPQIFAGLRISVAVALAVLVLSEMLAGTNGLGFFIFQSQETYRIPDMWSGIILLGILGYLVNLLFVLIERQVMRWHRGWRATANNAKG